VVAEAAGSGLGAAHKTKQAPKVPEAQAGPVVVLLVRKLRAMIAAAPRAVDLRAVGPADTAMVVRVTRGQTLRAGPVVRVEPVAGPVVRVGPAALDDAGPAGEGDQADLRRSRELSRMPCPSTPTATEN
jgi:hypothetical protein